MKLLLLVLSGNGERAHEWLRQKYSSASIELVSRDDLETENSVQRLRTLRAMQPDVLVIATERLAWQRRQNSLLALGAVVGARRVVLLDSYGDVREESRSEILRRASSRLLSEWAASRSAISQSRRRLSELSQRIKHRRSTKWATGNLTIAYLRSTPSPGSLAGGAATHINGFVRAAVDLGAQVNVISNDHIAGFKPSELKLIDPEPVGLTRAAFDLRNNLIFTAGVLDEIKKHPPDLIYQRYGRFTWAGIEASLNANVPLFLEYNGSEVWIGKYWDRSGMLPLLERFERLNLEAAQRIFVVSEVERQNLLGAGLPDEKIIVNPNGVDASRFHPSVGGEATRRELGVEEIEILAGFVGTFGPWHGVLTLADAIIAMPEGSNVRFLLVGAGKFREQVERMIFDAGKAKRVIFAGHVPHDRVPALLDACDMLLSPHVPLEDGSAFFGSPTKLFEYMAMGKAIVASRLGQIGEVLTDQETALLVEPGNARQLADAVLHLSQSRVLRERLGAAARRVAVERHTWQRNAGRVIEAYRLLAASSG